jgi:hypothetical protein
MTGAPVYAYAVLATSTPSPALVGVGGAPVRIVGDDELSVAVSDAPERVTRIDSDSDPALVAEVAVTHFEVVSALFRAGAVLPMRMCTLFDSDESALRAVRAAAPRFRDALRRVAGAAQWTVRIPLRPRRDDLAAQSSSGADYLRRLGGRRDEEARAIDEARTSAARLLEAAAGHAIDVEAGPDTGQQVSATYLVPAGAADAFLACVRSDTALRDVDLTGPFPPFAFVPQQAGAP